MAEFVCHSLDMDGRSVTMTIEANSPYEAAMLLREKGIRAYSISNGEKLSRKVRPGARLTQNEVQAFNEILLSTARAGQLFPSVIADAAREIRQPRLRAALESAAANIASGKGIAEAARTAEPKLPEIYISMLRAGELSENLPLVLDHFGAYAVRAARLRRRITGALVYPLLSGALVLIIFVFLCIAITPGLREIYASFGGEMPLLTALMYQLGLIFQSPIFYLPIITVVAVASVLAIWGRRLLPERTFSHVKYALESVVHHLPGIGRCQSLYVTAQFCQTLATLLKHNVLLPEAVDLAMASAGSARLERLRAGIVENLQLGETLPKALERQQSLSPTLLWILNTRWGNGDPISALCDMAEIAERDFDRTSNDLVRMLAPAILLLLSLVVLGSMLGVLMAFLEVPQLIV